MFENWKVLAGALTATGVRVCEAQGGYFLVADVSATNMSDVDYCVWLATEHKVVAVPLSVFYAADDDLYIYCLYSYSLYGYFL